MFGWEMLCGWEPQRVVTLKNRGMWERRGSGGGGGTCGVEAGFLRRGTFVFYMYLFRLVGPTVPPVIINDEDEATEKYSEYIEECKLFLRFLQRRNDLTE